MYTIYVCMSIYRYKLMIFLWAQILQDFSVAAAIHPFIIFIIIGIEGQTEDPELMFKILLPNFPITALTREVTTKKLQLL